MPDMKDKFKDRIRRSSVHDQLIDPVDDENTNVDINENDDTNVNVRKPSRVTRRTKFVDLHTRATFYIENDLLDELNQLAGDEKGEKTRIINDALRDYLKRQ